MKKITKNTLISVAIVIIVATAFILFAQSNIGEISDQVGQTPTSAPETVSPNALYSLQNHSHNIYSGKINQQEILMDIFRDGDCLTVSYVNKNSEDEIGGKNPIIEGVANINLSQGSKLIAALHIDGNQNFSDGLHAKISMSANNKAFDIVLATQYSISGQTEDDRYIFNKTQVETMAHNIKQDIVAGNKTALSKLIAYPLTVTIENKKYTYKNSTEFLNGYSKIITNNFLFVMSNAYTKFMFNNYNGIMVGSGNNNIWFTKNADNNKFQIVGINISG
ncbi:MAG: hypothetical protein Q8876_00740 [Bacillota bacterium]|nr:hypothetical protein [Bacillota bacterium]